MNDPFLNDGCTGFIDGIKQYVWEHCCNAHDIAFLNGQTLQDFISANAEFQVCIEQSGGGDPLVLFISLVMTFAVASPIGWLFFKRGKWGKAAR